MSTGMGRRRFLALAGGGVASFLAFYLSDSLIKPVAKVDLMRPPGAVEESAFLGTCIRCQRCIYVCPKSALKPATISDGLSKVFTPILDGECIYCWKCIDACPSGALRKISLEDYKVGTSRVINDLCIKCYICIRECPFNAFDPIPIPFPIPPPYPTLNPEICTGCGKCWVVCPVRPKRALALSSEGAKRVKAGRVI